MQKETMRQFEFNREKSANVTFIRVFSENTNGTISIALEALMHGARAVP
jgi:hypothetical protein